MSRGINKVILVATLGQDPELRHSASGAAIANFSCATSEQWKDKQSGQKQEKTQWHRCTAFNRLGEIVGEYLRKGSKVYLEGKLQTRKWQDQSGQDRYTTEIVVNELQMLDSRSDSSAAPQANNQQGGQGRSQQPQRQNNQRQAPSQEFDGFDDDIPFN